MAKCIVYNSPRDGVVVIHPAQNARLPDEPEHVFLSRIWARNIETAAQINTVGETFNPHLTGETPYFIVDVSEVPERKKRADWYAALVARAAAPSPKK